MEGADMQSDMERKRLTIFMHVLKIGGTQRVMLELLDGFARIGYSVDLVVAKGRFSEIPATVRLINLNSNNPFF